MTRIKGTARVLALLSLALSSKALVAAEYREIESMTVTGTRIHDAEPMSVVTLDRPAIERSGAVTLSGFMRDVVFNNSGMMDEQFTQGFAPASAAIDLRGLGAGRTLVLLDGRRLPQHPFGMNGSESFVDVNLIPLSSVQRIEVLKDGASAIYGADAVAGVVNIITRGADSGTRIGGHYSSSSEGDGEEAFLSFAGAATVGAAEFGLNVDYLDRQPIMARDRDISATANGPIDDRSNAGNPGTFITSAGPVPDAACPPERLRGPFCTYDFAPDVTLIPEAQRLGTSASWDQALTSSVGAFARVLYSHSESERDLAAAPNAYPVSAANPTNPFGEDVLAVYRTLELGPRRDSFETDMYQLTAGLNGVFGSWFWEASAGVGNVDTQIRGELGYALAADVQAAIDSGELNVFGDSPGFDAQALLYETERDGETDLSQLDFRMTGSVDLLPLEPIGVAVGIEYRDEEFSDQFDDASAAGEVIGVGGVSADGDRDVWAAYAEFSVPLSDVVELRLAGRYDDYSDFGGTFNPQLGLRWQATDDLLLRLAMGEGFKAPSLHELYSGDIFGFDSVLDTTNCEAAQAANDPVGIATYCDNVQEIPYFASGNEDLDAEDSTHFGIGAEYALQESLQLTLDYWWLKNENAVSGSPQFYIDNESQFPGSVIRDGAGDIAVVFSPFQNIAEQELWGIDADLRWRVAFAELGALETQLMTTYLGAFDEQTFSGGPVRDVAGEDGNAQWRSQVGLSWQRDSYETSLTLHHTSSYDRPAADDEIDDWTTVDLQFNWAPAPLKGGALALGLDNAFDEEPPEDPFLGGWPFFNRALHDPRGRYWYVRYTQDF